MSNHLLECVSPGHYRLNQSTWLVGPRYELQGFVGSGSYGEVCRAVDLYTDQIVAIKRIPNIMESPVLVKRVLREVCIMRRLRHPYIITLTDIFCNSPTNNSGVDLYIVTEFAERGDLCDYKGPLSPDDVRSLMWQLLVAVNYMHSCWVWHRDIKSGNTLLTKNMQIKLCDFGLARSAEETILDDITPKKKTLSRQYTKTVVTLCYRAPEVIMSQGEYNSAIDIWSVGCIFWELLMKSIYNYQQWIPLFYVRGEPVTPEDGQNYVKDGLSALADRLNVIFDVIGTPCWNDVQSVPGQKWRDYLKRLPGRAGNLRNDLVGHADNEAIDLLCRMLEFNPSRRCSSEEALNHAYFKNMRRSPDARQFMSEVSMPEHTTLVLEELERRFEQSSNSTEGGRVLMGFLTNEILYHRMEDYIRRSFLGSFQLVRHKIMKQKASNVRDHTGVEQEKNANKLRPVSGKGMQITNTEAEPAKKRVRIANVKRDFPLKSAALLAKKKGARKSKPTDAARCKR